MARPLQGKRILVTRSVTQAGELAERLVALGAEVLSLPGLEILPPADFGPLDAAIRELATFHWLVVTSRNAVAPFLDRLLVHGLGIEGLRHLAVAAVGVRTGELLASRGLPPSVVPEHHVALALALALAGRVEGRKVLLPRAERASELLPERLRAAGAVVTVAPVYRAEWPTTVDPGPVRAALAAGRLDAVTFGSARTVEGVLELLGDEARDLLGKTRIICLGPVTALACRAAGLLEPRIAEPSTIDGLIQAVVRSLS